MPRSLRVRIHDIMFQHDSVAERTFDGTLVIAIVLSVVVVMLDSVAAINARYGAELAVAEWCFTVLFTVEYLLRVLRVFRILKLAQYVQEASVLSQALRASRHKITVFITTVLSVVVISGSVMYMVEGAERGFTSIPMSIYWAIVTMTTVGYGDLAPQTALGQTLASVLMIVGYGVIAVPTAIVTLELDRASRARTERERPGCGSRR